MMRDLLISLRTGFFLTSCYIRKSSRWLLGLLAGIMFLTFINLVVVNGFLVGLIDGAYASLQENHTADIFITRSDNYVYLQNTQKIIETLDTIPGVEVYSPRYRSGGTLEETGSQDITNDRNKLVSDVGVTVFGINPVKEIQTVLKHKHVIEGEFLAPGDADYIVIGANRFKRHFPADILEGLLGEVYVGDSVWLNVGDFTKKYTVKGVLKSKADVVDFGAFILDTELQKIAYRFDHNVSEIAVKIREGYSIDAVYETLIAANFDESVDIQLSDAPLLKFLIEIRDTFELLGSIIGYIALVVASITILIVIFILVITRKTLIGILKGLGLTQTAIVSSYATLALILAIIGSCIACLTVVFFIKPYFDVNPINFPFSDGILAVYTYDYIRAFILILVATAVASIVPAKLIVSKNTLDAILGR